ncbi:MAG: OmpA family protein [Myxococcales bacterium]|nr:OmpA family protein [Myxococcales bacterium]
MRVHIATVLSVLALAGCSKKSNTKVAEPTEPSGQVAATPKPATATAPPTQVSPNLNVSGDLAAQCGLKASAAVPPNFEYDQTELLPEDRQVLEQVAVCLTTGPLTGRGLDLIGRADPRGTGEYNLGLGARRAQSVSDYLHKLGVTAPQLAETTRGDLEATGTDESGWQKDRRVDLELRD